METNPQIQNLESQIQNMRFQRSVLYLTSIPQHRSIAQSTPGGSTALKVLHVTLHLSRCLHRPQADARGPGKSVIGVSLIRRSRIHQVSAKASYLCFFDNESALFSIMREIPITGRFSRHGIENFPHYIKLEVHGLEPRTSCMQSRRSPN